MSARGEDYDILVDARGLACPQPLRLLRGALRHAQAGATICLMADDPHALIDVAAHCARAGHALESEEMQGSTLRLRIRKRGD
ncbi:MAG TPA: sulfurtransferase TusA family protein [Tahibacter sp.]|nr:sulfurtransferase TusA family protein [Tahibacter sp.]